MGGLFICNQKSFSSDYYSKEHLFNIMTPKNFSILLFSFFALVFFSTSSFARIYPQISVSVEYCPPVVIYEESYSSPTCIFPIIPPPPPHPHHYYHGKHFHQPPPPPHPRHFPRNPPPPRHRW